MRNLAIVEIKAFVPARDFELSKKFYQDVGFEMAWSDEELAYFRRESLSFLLQNLYVQAHADNFMMHLLVADADGWWQELQEKGIAAKYGVRLGKPEDRAWGLRDFVLFDPTGVLWRIGCVSKR